MKKTSLALLLIAVSFSAIAEKIEVDGTQENCRKIVGYGANDKLFIATKYEVSMSSVSFIGAKWWPGEYGGETCILIFDTSKGPKQCYAKLFSDDNGKTVFGVVALLPSACFSK